MSVCVCTKGTLLKVILVSGHVKFYTVNDVAFSPERCVYNGPFVGVILNSHLKAECFCNLWVGQDAKDLVSRQ